MNAHPMQLTSQYARGVRGAEDAALDADGRDWYRHEGPLDQDDDDVPVWPSCMACGQGVDYINEPHWFFADVTGGMDRFLHDDPRCVRLTYPSGEADR